MKITKADIDRSWVIGPFDSLEQMRTVWQCLKDAGGPMLLDGFVYMEVQNLHNDSSCDQCYWRVTNTNPTITPTDFLQRMGHKPDISQTVSIDEKITDLWVRRWEKTLPIPESIKPYLKSSCTCTTLLFGHDTSCSHYKETAKDRLDKAVGFAIRQPVHQSYKTISDGETHDE